MGYWICSEEGGLFGLHGNGKAMLLDADKRSAIPMSEFCQQMKIMSIKLRDAQAFAMPCNSTKRP